MPDNKQQVEGGAPGETVEDQQRAQAQAEKQQDEGTVPYTDTSYATVNRGGSISAEDVDPIDADMPPASGASFEKDQEQAAQSRDEQQEQQQNSDNQDL